MNTATCGTLVGLLLGIILIPGIILMCRCYLCLFKVAAESGDRQDLLIESLREQQETECQGESKSPS